MSREPDDPLDLPFPWDAMVVLFYAPVLLGSALWILVYGGTWTLWHRLLGDRPLMAVALGIAAGVALAALTRVAASRGPGRRAADALGRMLAPLSVVGAASWVLSSAITEELFFRGVLQPRLGAALATTLFAAAHVPVERALWPWPIAALAVLVLTREATTSLVEA